MSFFSFIFHIFLFSSRCYRWICSKTPIKSYSFAVISYIPAHKILKKSAQRLKVSENYTHSPLRCDRYTKILSAIKKTALNIL